MDLLQVARLHGLEPMPKLDDIPELKQVFTPGVLIILKEKYEIPNQKIYTRTEYQMYSKRFQILYLEQYVFDEEYILIRREDDVKMYKMRDGEFSSTNVISWSTRFGKIIPLRINSKPLNEKERELAILYVEQKKVNFLYNIRE